MPMKSWWDRGLIVQQSYTLEDNGFANCQVENESDDDLQWRRRAFNSAKKPISLEKSSLGGNIIKALEYLRA
jgi:hypothetical protein